MQVAAESRLESRRDPLFEEPSRVVVFDLAFVRERFFDLQSGALIEKVSPNRQFPVSPFLATGRCKHSRSKARFQETRLLAPSVRGGHE